MHGKPMSWNGGEKWKRGERHARDFAVRGWPAILLVGLAVLVFAGPMLGLVFFFLKIALMLLPFVIVGGLLMLGARSLMGGDRHKYYRQFRGRWNEGGKQKWREWMHDWDDEEKDKPKAMEVNGKETRYF